MKQLGTLTLNGRQVPIADEKNLLELIRKAGIDLPTFCYHSTLSVYGACRLCIVDIEGRGVATSCSTVPEPGMVVQTHTAQLRKMRKITLELLLANHHQTCTTCVKSDSCRLQDLARRGNITNVRFKTQPGDQPIDDSNPSLVRDPNKCILCGDCVRACEEIQSIGAIDFVHRGSKTTVQPAYGKELKDVDCVYCGLCSSVCPTGAITPKSMTDEVWNQLNDPKKTVVVQIAPAVRVALGEMFGLKPGTLTTGKMVAALKMLGFDKVFDTSFAADMTVLEETNEFLLRREHDQPLPLFTSCCPAWVKFAEQYYPDLLPHVSSCRSPQQMFGAIARDTLPKELNVVTEDLYLVSIMPCTAKKFEANRPEFGRDGVRDVDAVLTTQEFGQMIKQAGIQFNELTPESLDMPLGFKTGAGVIFGTTGGVSEAVLRYASEKVTGIKNENTDFVEVRGTEGVRIKSLQVGDITLKLAIVHGLGNARAVAEQVREGSLDVDFIEVMACPGGCIAGAGQPVSLDVSTKMLRAQGLYNADKTLQLHTSQDNPYLQACYKEHLGKVGSEKAHHLLHTHYKARRRFDDNGFAVSTTPHKKLEVCVCVGTSCYLRGSQKLLQTLMTQVKQKDLQNSVDVHATFCFEACDRGPTVRIGDDVLHKCTVEQVMTAIEESLAVASD